MEPIADHHCFLLL